MKAFFSLETSRITWRNDLNPQLECCENLISHKGLLIWSEQGSVYLYSKIHTKIIHELQFCLYKSHVKFAQYLICGLLFCLFDSDVMNYCVGSLGQLKTIC
jgi:hypothetical protein